MFYLCWQLLMKNPDKRLTDLLALQNTAFYSNFNFTAVLEKKVCVSWFVFFNQPSFFFLLNEYL